MRPLPSLTPRRAQTGLSLVELMIAIALGLLILAGLTTIFVNSSRARDEVEKANQQIENGRYAMQVLSEDLRLSGFLGEFDISAAAIATPTSKPDACATVLADLKAAMPLHIQGYDDGADAPTCLSDLKANTDIIVIRRASTCVAGSTDCAAVTTGAPYFQASLCMNATELLAASSASYYRLDTNTANLDRHKRDCTTVADLRRYITRIYYIANNDVGSDGIPTLKRAELGAGGFSIVPIAEGVENLQLDYGIDTNNDGQPDVYSSDPDTYNSCAGVVCVDNWRNVMAVKINLLARNTQKSAGFSDSKTYTLGATTVGPFNDSYKRHAYVGSVRLTNPAGRRE